MDLDELKEFLVGHYAHYDVVAYEDTSTRTTMRTVTTTIMITGTTHKEQAYELLQAGVRKIFPKPFSMKMLARAIEEHFSKS